MTFRNDLFQKGVTEQQATFLAQGFLELLGGQIAVASKDANLAIRLFKAGRTDELNAALQDMGQRLAEAVFSYRTASLLMGKDNDDCQIGPL